MIILIRVDYEGDDLQNDLKKMNAIHAKIEKATGGKIEGTILPPVEHPSVHISC